MDQADVISVLRQAVVLAIKLASPILIVSIAVGLVISILQAATQIHEQTLSFVPKVLAIALILILLASWMITSMLDFTNNIFSIMSSLS